MTKTLILVEGPSDELLYKSVLGGICKERFEVVSTAGDITSDNRYHGTGVELLEELVTRGPKNAKDVKIDISDVSKIIIITDTDGCFISNEYITKTEGKIKYYPNGIHAPKPDDIKERNSLKRTNLIELLNAKKFKNIPIEIYYNSVNLDHVTCNKMNMNSHKKRIASLAFAKKLKTNEDIAQFFIENIDSNYKESWKYIMKNLNSLLRHSNVGLMFKGNKDLFNKEFNKCLNAHLNQANSNTDRMRIV